MFGRCATLCCLLTVGLWGSVPVHAAELHPISKLEIERSGDSWTCSGVNTINDRAYSTIQFGMEHMDSPLDRPVVTGEILYVLERTVVSGPLQFARHQHCLTQLSVASGEVLSSIYLTVHTNAEHPVQVYELLRWGNHILVDGYYQEETGLENMKGVILLIGPQGEPINIFFNDYFCEPAAVDETNDLLICTQRYQGRDSDGHKIPADPVFHVFDLPSLTLHASYPKDLLVLQDMIADASGNLYCLRLDTQEWEAYQQDETLVPSTRHLVKYAIEPWQELWTKRIQPENYMGYPRLLQFRDGLLWYSMHVNNYALANHPEEEYRWIEKPLDPETGEPVETEQRFDPYRTVVDVQGQPYAITWLFGSFRVEPLGSPVGKWEGYR